MNLYHNDMEETQVPLNTMGVKLSPVTLDKTDTCWTYCLKRVGLKCGIRYANSHGELYFYNGCRDTEMMFGGTYKQISTDHNRLEEHFARIPILSDDAQDLGEIPETYCTKSALKPGDLLLFTHRESTQFLADTISADGSLEYTSHKIRRHVAVYEGNGCVSHAVYAKIGTGVIGMEIRVQTLDSFDTPPTHVLKLKS